jgi:replicative DNA helicase
MYLGKSEPAQKEGESLERYQSRVQHWHEAKARDAGRAELIIEKVRDGEPGSVILTFCGETTSFVEVAPQ